MLEVDVRASCVVFLFVVYAVDSSLSLYKLSISALSVTHPLQKVRRGGQTRRQRKGSVRKAKYVKKVRFRGCWPLTNAFVEAPALPAVAAGAREYVATGGAEWSTGILANQHAVRVSQCFL